MPKFFYKGRSVQGELVEGFLEAGSSDAVANQLFNTGVTPIDINEDVKSDNQVINVLQQALQKKPSLDDIIMFSRQMYALTRSGVPIVKGISGVAQSTRNQKLKNALEDIVEYLSAGHHVASALSQHKSIFSPLYISIIQVGENSGSLDDAFNRVYEYLMREKDTIDRIKSASRYPMIVLMAVMAALGLANFFIIPVFAKLYENFDDDLPVLTQILVMTSDFTINYWQVVVVIVVASVIGVKQYINTEQGRLLWDRYKLKMPAVGNLLKRAALARYCRSLSISLRSGVPLIQALMTVSRAVGNVYISSQLLSMREGIEHGESLTKVAGTTEMFPPLVLQMLAVGEESGTLEEMLLEVAEYYDREVDYDLKYLSDALQPILVTIMGVLVLVLALGLFLPLWDMYGIMASR